MKDRKVAVLFALLAAVLYAMSVPFSKLLLANVPSALMAGFLYIGAGVGMAVIYFANSGRARKDGLLTRSDARYVVGMVLLDIAAPVLFMYGLISTASANVSLLGNFEIVATAMIALVFFKEVVSVRLWTAIAFITLSSVILSLEETTDLHFSAGSLLVLLATICWGFENNCTRSISTKNTCQIVAVKGVGSGIGSLVVGAALGEKLPGPGYIALVMVLGFFAYGLSIFLYIRAQKELGAARTSAYYAAAPFVGAFLSFIFLEEQLAARYFVALALMAVGSVIATVDTLLKKHEHTHTHVIVHTHDGSTHTHEISHCHEHGHLLDDKSHGHRHSRRRLVELAHES